MSDEAAVDGSKEEEAARCTGFPCGQPKGAIWVPPGWKVWDVRGCLRLFCSSACINAMAAGSPRKGNVIEVLHDCVWRRAVVLGVDQAHSFVDYLLLGPDGALVRVEFRQPLVGGRWRWLPGKGEIGPDVPEETQGEGSAIASAPARRMPRRAEIIEVRYPSGWERRWVVDDVTPEKPTIWHAELWRGASGARPNPSGLHVDEDGWRWPTETSAGSPESRSSSPPPGFRSVFGSYGDPWCEMCSSWLNKLPDREAGSVEGDDELRPCRGCGKPTTTRAIRRRKRPEVGDIVEIRHPKHGWQARKVRVLKREDGVFAVSEVEDESFGRLSGRPLDNPDWRWPGNPAPDTAQHEPDEADLAAAGSLGGTLGLKNPPTGATDAAPSPPAPPPGFRDVGGGYWEADVLLTQAEATKAERLGLSTTEDAPRSPIAEALRREIIDVVTRGDARKGGAFTAAVAIQVQKICAAAREIILAQRVAENDISALLQRKGGINIGGGMFGGGIMGLGELGDDDGVLPLAGAPAAENFGTQAIRQLVEGLRGMNDSPAKLVEALALARSQGLTDVAASLEKKLGVEPGSRGDGWTCGTCRKLAIGRKYDLPGAAGVCMACFDAASSRDDGIALSFPGISQWRCPCGWANQVMRRVCRSCGSPRPGESEADEVAAAGGNGRGGSGVYVGAGGGGEGAGRDSRGVFGAGGGGGGVLSAAAAGSGVLAKGGSGTSGLKDESVVDETCRKCGKALPIITRKTLETLNITPEAVDSICVDCHLREREVKS